ncbi:hypothetical protein [Streptomyces olivochromogenes]|uniref:hypothetical protein n=1 Tax=Streptomyces olivochromogenes TaxID=1963 RepID=UPI001F46C14F|nr:hypothetical protein [Streptomyces olivochromogenes]MCF3132754.1 hypothetical protein [Streptomyces olivochromogenes]
MTTTTPPSRRVLGLAATAVVLALAAPGTAAAGDPDRAVPVAEAFKGDKPLTSVT